MTADRRTLRKRGRRAAEKLYGNSALRDNLDDAQAKPLLKWGSAYTERAVQQTRHLPDEDAAAVIETHTAAVQTILRTVNEITPTLHQLSDDDEAAAALDPIQPALKTLNRLPHDWQDRTADLLHDRAERGPEETFAALMSLLPSADESEPEAPAPAAEKSAPEQPESDTAEPADPPLKLLAPPDDVTADND